MSKVFVVVDTGCIECGVETLVLGVFKTKQKAVAVRDAQVAKFNNWRGGGQNDVEIFEAEL